MRTYSCNILDRLVGYCEVAGADFGRMMMDNTQCKINIRYLRYDRLDRYKH